MEYHTGTASYSDKELAFLLADPIKRAFVDRGVRIKYIQSQLRQLFANAPSDRGPAVVSVDVLID